MGFRQAPPPTEPPAWLKFSFTHGEGSKIKTERWPCLFPCLSPLHRAFYLHTGWSFPHPNLSFLAVHQCPVEAWEAVMVCVLPCPNPL